MLVRVVTLILLGALVSATAFAVGYGWTRGALLAQESAAAGCVAWE